MADMQTTFPLVRGSRPFGHPMPAVACSVSRYSSTTGQALCDPKVGLSRWWHHCYSFDEHRVCK